MSGNELISAITVIAAVIAEGRTTEEITILAAIFVQIGDTLATIAAQNSIAG